jgi:hypothetical protein
LRPRPAACLGKARVIFAEQPKNMARGPSTGPIVRFLFYSKLSLKRCSNH